MTSSSRAFLRRMVKRRLEYCQRKRMCQASSFIRSNASRTLPDLEVASASRRTRYAIPQQKIARGRSKQRLALSYMHESLGTYLDPGSQSPVRELSSHNLDFLFIYFKRTKNHFIVMLSPSSQCSVFMRSTSNLGA